MEISILITKQIVEMFFMIVIGAILVRIKIVDKDTGIHLSKITLNLILPCVIINAFQIEYSKATKDGLILALVLALILNGILIIVPRIFSKWLKLSPVERASLSYPNSGEILIPLVVSILSKEMQIYCCAFMLVQIIFIFTHGVSLLSGQSKLQWKNVLKNVNVIAIVVALLIFICKIPLPEMVTGVIDSFSAMLAPICMLSIGITVGNCNLKEIFSDKRIYLICFLRLIIIPVIILFLLKISNVVTIMEQAKDIILIVFMATASSTSATITNMAFYYKNEAQRASFINIMSILFLVVTLPVMVMLYQIIM